MANANIDFQQIGAQFQNLNMRDVGTWPPLPKFSALLAMLVVILGLGWFLDWSDRLQALDNAKQEESRLKDEYKQKLQQAINLDALRKQKELVGQYVQALEKQLPSRAEMDALLSDINQAGLGRGLQFELFKPGQVAAKQYYAELPIDVRVVGGYHDIGAFTSDIANLPRIVTLNNLDIKVDDKNPGRLSLNAVAKTFRYLDADEIEAQRKAAADAKKGGAK
jgi:type IV pilus assembly protein PilO